MKSLARGPRLVAVIIAMLALVGGISPVMSPRPVTADVTHTPHGAGGPVAPVTVDVSSLPSEPRAQEVPAETQPVGHDVDEATYRLLKEQARNTALPATAGGRLDQSPVHANDPRPSTPSLGASFQGFAATGYYPPDAAIAASSSHVLVAVNASWAVYDKSGHRLSGPTTFASLFAPLGLPAGTSYFDPRALYDPSSNRWFLVAAAKKTTSQQSWFAVAVSAGASPLERWNTYALDGSTNASDSTANWADFPGLGIDSQAVYLTANMFRWEGNSFQYSKIRILDKSQLIAGGNVQWHDFWDMRDASTLAAFTLQPAVTYGTPGVEYLISGGRTSGGCTSYLTLWSINNPLDAQPALSQQTIDVTSYCFAPDAEQPGTSTRIDTGDTRLLSAVYQNGSLWTAQNAAMSPPGGIVAGIRWYEVLPASTSVRQSGTFGANAAHSYYPTIMPDNGGDAAIVFTRSSSDTPAEARYTERWSTDPLGSLQSSKLLKAGSGSYVKLDPNSLNRWGDYSAAALDPDGRTVWMTNEYVSGPNTWAMWVGSAAPRVYQVGTFFVDVAASAGDTAVSLGRPIELHNFTIQEGQPLPSGSIPYSGTVAGTTFDATLTLGLTSVDPFTVALQRYQISLGTGQSADVANIGTVDATVPGTTDFSETVTQTVAGIGDVTFTFSGQVQVTVQ